MKKTREKGEGKIGMSFRVVENNAYQNLSGGYISNTGPGPTGIDSVAMISGRRNMSLPNLQPPGPDVPIPTTTQQHNRRSNITIPYARTCGSSLMAGEIVFVSRPSSAAPRGPSSRILQASASLARVFSIEQVNKEFEASTGVQDTDIANFLNEKYSFGDWCLDGVVMSVDHDDAASMRYSNGKSISAPHFDSSYAPLVNVAIQGYAEIVSDIEQDEMGRVVVDRRVLPKKAVAGAVVYVGLFTLVQGDGTFKGKLIRFSSLDITNKKFILDDGVRNCVRAWRIGTVVDTKKRIRPQHITVAVDIRRIDTGLFMKAERLPKYVDKELGSEGEYIDLQWRKAKLESNPALSDALKKIVTDLAVEKTVVEQLKAQWEI